MKVLQFILNLTWREIRSSWRRLLFFFLCIGIGVGSIVALRSAIQNLNRAVAAEARFLLTADVEINSTGEFNEAEKNAVETVISNNQSIIEARSNTIQTTTMTHPTDEARDGSQMLELKGVESNFPIVGQFQIDDGRAFDYALIQNGGAICSALLLERLNLRIGDKIRIGMQDFELRATFTEEPGGTAGFRLGPRVFIEQTAFDSAGLTSFGSRNRRRILLRAAPETSENLTSQLRAALKNVNSIAAVRSYREAEESTTENFERAENYLSLTGLVILVLGGIGVWNVTRVFIEQKKNSIAVLKCVGATGNKVSIAYLLQILSLGFLGSVFGAFLAQIALILIQRNFAASLPKEMAYNLQPGAILQGFLLGLFVSGLFAALPLLQIRNIKPRLLLRDNSGETLKKFNFFNIVVGAIVVFGLLILAVWQANSWRVGAYFLGGLLITAIILYLAAFLLLFLLKRLRFAPFFAFRQAINSLSRPGNQTRVILLAVGLGVFVVVGVQMLQRNLLREFDLTRAGSLPTLFLIDVRPTQADAVKNLLQTETGENVEFIPAIRGRIAAINGESIDLNQREIRQQSGQIGREYVLTYRQKIVGEEQITAGEFWDETPSSVPEVSLDEGMRGLQNLDVGGTITFDISGQKTTARVTSFRRLDVRNPRSTFIVVFRPGVLETAPQTFLAPVFAPLDAATRARVQRNLVNNFPNVAVIDTADTVATIKKLLDNITLAVSFVGFFVFFSGVLILVGSIALTKFQRVYDNAILKTLGAKRLVLLTILLAEYGILGLLAGIIGVGAATGLAFAVSNYVFKIVWKFDFNLAIFGLLTTILLVMIVGAISSFDVIFRRPLSILRAQ